MCHFLPVYYLGIVFSGRVEGQNITLNWEKENSEFKAVKLRLKKWPCVISCPSGGVGNYVRLFWNYYSHIFVAASHQTRLDTRSKARRPIKVGIKGRGRSGTSRDSNPACLCCSSAHLVQCEPDEASSFTNPNVSPGTYASLRLKLDAWSSAVQRGQKCSSPTRRLPSRSWGPIRPRVCSWFRAPIRHECQTAQLKSRGRAQAGGLPGILNTLPGYSHSGIQLECHMRFNCVWQGLRKRKSVISCQDFWNEAWWFLSLSVFGLLSSSLRT